MKWKTVERLCVFMCAALLCRPFFCYAAVAHVRIQASAFYEETDTSLGESNTGWEEDYTDTDMRRGILAVRAETFEGFHGIVYVVFQEIIGGRQWELELDGERMYLANLTLPVGRYRVMELAAVSGGREFDINAEQEEIEINDGKTTACRIAVEPNSLYRFPYEETEWEDEAEQDGSHLAEEGNIQTEGVFSENEPEESENGEGMKEHGVSIFFVIGLLGMTLCTGSLFYVLKKKREGG